MKCLVLPPATWAPHHAGPRLLPDLQVAELAGILAVSAEEVAAALSVACRLGFAMRVHPPSEHTALTSASSFPLAAGAVSRTERADGLLIGDPPGQGPGVLIASGDLITFGPDSSELPMGEAGADAAMANAAADAWLGGLPEAGASSGVPPAGAGDAQGGGGGRAVAVVLDSEATSFLMMGALSPGG